MLTTDTGEETKVLEDKRAAALATIKATYRLARTLVVQTAAIGEATGNSQTEVVQTWLKTMNEKWVEEATQDQRARYQEALARLSKEMGVEADEPEPTVKARPAAKKGGR